MMGEKGTSYVFAVSGIKNSGKTTLITRVLPILARHGIRTAVIKHDGHDFEADVPGTDSYRHFQAGAYGTAVFSGEKYMVVKRQKQTSEEELMNLFPEADLILLEGFKDSFYPKIEVIRRGNSGKSVCREGLWAVATDLLPEELPDIDAPLLNLNAPEEIAAFLMDAMSMERPRTASSGPSLPRRSGSDGTAGPD